MSLLVDVREVPWRILELVQARILANRERKARRQQVSDVRKHTRPRPQQRRMGASMSIYREPEPVPLVLGDLDKIAFAVVEETVSGNDLVVTVSNRDRTQSVTLTIPQLVKTYPQSDWFGGEDGSDFTETGERFDLGFNGLWWLTPDFPGLDKSTKVHTTTTRTQLKRDVAVGSESGLILLPCGSEAAILIYRYDAVSCTAIVRITSVNTDTRIVTDTYTYNSPDGIQDNWVLIGRQSQGTSTAQALTSSQTRCVYRAVYIGAHAAKEVPVPAALRSRLAQICPEPDQLGGTPSAPLATGSFGSSYYNPPNQIIETGEFLISGYPVLGVTGSSSYYPPYSSVTVNMPQISPSISSAAADAYALTGWGLYRRNNSQDATPGIFSFLDRFNPASASGDESSDYAYAKQQYLSDAPVPSRFLGPCVLEGSCNWDNPTTGTVRLDKTTTIPATRNTIIPVSSFRPGTRKYTVEIGEGSDYYMAWDWGRPAYCRQRLLALGFTEADLTP